MNNNPKIIPPHGVKLPPGSENAVLVGGAQQIVIQPSALCAQCFPKPAPAVMVWAGFSLCPDCAVNARRWYDDWGTLSAGPVEPVTPRRGEDYQKAWGVQHPRDGAPGSELGGLQEDK